MLKQWIFVICTICKINNQIHFLSYNLILLDSFIHKLQSFIYNLPKHNVKNISKKTDEIEMK